MNEIFIAMGQNMWIRLALGLVMGGFIGFERELHGRPAGFRTHILVCLGAVILMISTELLIPSELSEMRHHVLGRIIAGVITGIGFLGAGVILRVGDTVRGLTTAASIWFTAALGVAIGEGLVLLSLIGTVLILIVLTVFNRLDVLIPPIVYRKIVVHCTRDQVSDCREAIETVFSQFHVHVHDILAEFNQENPSVRFEYQVHVRNRIQGYDIAKQISEISGVCKVRWAASQ
ncbi:MgtC/SapB family protein [bacterium]|nr:MgtC/SapB family protein [bacterium]